MTTTEAPPTAAEEKPISEWLQQKIEAREAAKAAGIPAPPRGGRRRPTASATPPKKKTAPPRPRTPKKTDYRQGITGAFQIISLPLAFAAPADAAAITAHAPTIAEALNDLAQDRPEVAAVLDRILAGGPYAALFAAMLPLGVQLAHNHGLIPEQMASQMGATPKRHILAQLRAQAEAQKAERAAWAAQDAA
jgi:hypothetical protein